MLDISGLTVRYGSHAAVRDVSFQLHPGERLGIVGESGSGKSTVAQALMGMVAESAALSGSVKIAGREMIAAGERDWRLLRGSRIAMIFQEPLSALNPLMRVGAIVAEPMRVLDGLSQAQAEANVQRLFAEVGLPDPERKARQYPHELSGGQRQRVLIALALSRDPGVLVADEPTTALDAQVARRVIDLLVELSLRRQMTLVFISHDLGAVARATERLVVMYGGDIVEDGPTADILLRPRHPYTKGLIAARPTLDGVRERRTRLSAIPGTVPALADLPAGCRFAGRCSLELDHCASVRPMLGLQGQTRAACHHVEPAAQAMPAAERFEQTA